MNAATRLLSWVDEARVPVAVYLGYRFAMGGASIILRWPDSALSRDAPTELFDRNPEDVGLFPQAKIGSAFGAPQLAQSRNTNTKAPRLVLLAFDFVRPAWLGR